MISIIKKLFLTRDNKPDYICLSLLSWWASVVSPWHTFCKNPHKDSLTFLYLLRKLSAAHCPAKTEQQQKRVPVGTWLFLSISYKILQPLLLKFNIHKSCYLPHLPLGSTKEQQSCSSSCFLQLVWWDKFILLLWRCHSSTISLQTPWINCPPITSVLTFSPVSEQQHCSLAFEWGDRLGTSAQCLSVGKAAR